MANITSELQTIRSGIFGKDVRAAIADGLEKINENGGPGGSGGPGIESITQMYLRTSSTSVTTSTSGWSTTPGTLTSGQWLWTYFKINLDDGTEVSSAPICIGNYNARLSSVSLYQLRNSSTSTPSTTASGWTTSNQEPTSSAPYVWGCLRFTYYPTNGSSSHTVYSNVFRLKTYQEPAPTGEHSDNAIFADALSILRGDYK